MKLFSGGLTGVRAAATLLVLAAFVGTLALSASPLLHERVHPDANQSQHECAVTLVAAGKCDHCVSGPVVDRPVARIEIFEIPTLDSLVASLFLRASIFEHAPPALI